MGGKTRKFKEGDRVHVTHGDWGNNNAVVLADEGDSGTVQVEIQCHTVEISRHELELISDPT